jgi:hypothetical protein
MMTFMPSISFKVGMSKVVVNRLDARASGAVGVFHSISIPAPQWDLALQATGGLAAT